VRGEEEEKVYEIPYGSRIRVKEGQMVEAADEITDGSVNPHDILSIKGVDGVQNYIIKEVQRVYRMQGVDINDKHIEVIVRQMLGKIKVEDDGESGLLPGSLESIYTFEDASNKVIEQGLEPAQGRRVLLGITKASLATESFLSAASFQETTRVLTEAAIKGKEDFLIGLKENVIIGKLIPAGTGMKKYLDIALDAEPEVTSEADLDLETDSEVEALGSSRRE
jgi:DNA-directed RNA polymerase subunit beta'